MRQFLALCTLLFLWCTATTAFAAPQSVQDQAQTISTATVSNDYDLARTSFLVNTEPARFLPGSSVAISQNLNGMANSKSAREEQSFYRAGMKEVLTVFDNNGGNSANLTTTAWTATDHDDGAISQFFFLSNTSAATTSAQQPDYQLRC